MDPRIDLLLEQFAEFRVDISGLKTDVATLKTDVATLKTDVATLKTDVATLKKDVATLKTDVATLTTGLDDLTNNYKLYVKQDSIIQEHKDRLFLQTHIHERAPHLRVKRSYINHFYNFNGIEITEIDGCILIQSPDTSANMTLIVESKRALDKTKVDQKLQQILEIRSVLGDLENPAKTSAAVGAFRTMVQTHALQEFPKEVQVVFASDCIPTGLQIFLQALYAGKFIDPDTYEKYTFIALYDDPLYQEILSNLKKKRKQRILMQLERATTLAQIREVFSKDSDLSNYTKYMNEFCTDYTNVVRVYAESKQRFGVLYCNVLSMDHLLPPVLENAPSIEKAGLKTRKNPRIPVPVAPSVSGPMLFIHNGGRTRRKGRRHEHRSNK